MLVKHYAKWSKVTVLDDVKNSRAKELESHEGEKYWKVVSNLDGLHLGYIRRTQHPLYEHRAIWECFTSDSLKLIPETNSGYKNSSLVALYTWVRKKTGRKASHLYKS